MTSLSDLMTGNGITLEEADRLLDQYPYFVYPQAESYREAYDAETLRRLRQRLAALIGDREALEEVVGAGSAEMAGFYPDMGRGMMSTAETIDNFLERFGTGVVIPTDHGGAVPVTPAIDYAATLLADPAGEPSGTPDLTSLVEAVNGAGEEVSGDQDAETVPAVTAGSAVTEADKGRRESEGAALTESLARIMVKNGNYRKALEIITQLNLKNPEKSIYFADQIRFLRKLILNQSKS